MYPLSMGTNRIRPVCEEVVNIFKIGKKAIAFFDRKIIKSRGSYCTFSSLDPVTINKEKMNTNARVTH